MIRRSLGHAVVLVCFFAAILPVKTSAQQPIVGHPQVAEAVRLLDAWLEAEQAYGRLPGLSIAIASDAGLVWAKGYGHADVERGVPASPTTRYLGCSIAKLFTATAVMQLRDDGKLQLEDPVERHLDWLPARPFRRNPDYHHELVDPLVGDRSGPAGSLLDGTGVPLSRPRRDPAVG